MQVLSSAKREITTNRKILKMIYYSPFCPHLQYEAQLCRQANTESQKQIQLVQDKAVEKIYFILKFKDMFHLQNCPFLNQIEQNEKLLKTFPTLKYCGYTN